MASARENIDSFTGEGERGVQGESRPTTANSIGGTVYGAAVQAGSIGGDLHIHVSGSIGEAADSCRPPDGWDDLPELPAEVRSLVRAQLQVAQELPYRLPGARRPSLATVYVRQDLGGASEEQASEPPRPAPSLDERGQLVGSSNGPVVRSATRAPSRAVREALDDADHMLVTGGPGQGKSTLSLRLAADVAERWMSPNADGALVRAENHVRAGQEAYRYS
ncbi:hypothetical protein [Saccharopolyspora shandongensis]|uniref:hypothetical protein n=1 Tax=Saccharopolyspora shandongensis TaxID=418495 RepID=UPI0033D6D700